MLDPTDPQKVCKANEDKSVENSGAPIHVMSPIKETATGKDKITFTFTIKHMASGQIFDSKQTELCTHGSQYEDEVFVKVSTEFMSEPACTPIWMVEAGIKRKIF